VDDYSGILRYLAIIAVYLLGATVVTQLLLQLRRWAPTRRTLARLPEYLPAWRALGRSENAEALDLAWRAYERCREGAGSRRRPALACCETLLGTALHEAGRNEEALVYLRPAEATLARAREYDGGLIKSVYRGTLHALAETLADVDEREEALTLTDRSLRWHVRYGMRRRTMITYHLAHYVRGRVLLRDGRFAEAASAAREALTLRRGTTSDPDVIVAACLVLTAEIALATERADLAQPVADEAVAHARMLPAGPAPHRSVLAEALAIRARVLAALDRTGEALEAITESVELTRKLADELPDTYRADLATREAAASLAE